VQKWDAMVTTKNNDKMAKTKIYIAGPITGYDLNERRREFDFNQSLLEIEGFEVVNPMALPHDHDKSWESYMKECIEALLKCDTICLLHGWNKSKGAKLEFDIANAMEYKIIIEK
jgi:hypothetical protein